MKKYYYLVLSQQDLLKSQVIEELLRERVTYLINEQKPIDFWIVMTPVFLENKEIQKKIIKTRFFEQNKKLLINNDKIYVSMILSTNIDYLRWLNLRLGYFEKFQEQIIESEFKFKSDGLFGIIEADNFFENNPFLFKKPLLDPKIRLEKFSEVYSN